jgi:hypothetical protein
MGNDSYALTNMNALDIPLEASGNRSGEDQFIYFDVSAGGFKRGIAPADNRLVTIANGTNTLALTAKLHAHRKLLVLDATLAITLPEATGTGNVYTIIQGIAATSSTIVTADTANCGFHGFIMGSDTDAAGNYNWIATGAQDTITFNGTSTGGKLYDWIRVTDVATDAWLLEGNIKQSGGSEATPLSSAA